MAEELISGYCDQRFEPVAEVFRASLSSKFEVGASFAVEHMGRTVIDLWGGHQDAERTKSWERDTIVNVFSVTKGVTAICVARLIEQGHIDINEKISCYWPDYGCNGKEDTTVLDVLCHRSANFGFQNEFPNENWTDWNLFTKTLSEQAPFEVPGTIQAYHALTFGWLVGELIRRVDGRSVGTYFKEELAEPLDLDFKIGLDDADFGRCADMLMLEKLPSISQLNILKYVPDFALSNGLRNIKLAVKSGYNPIAFDNRALADNPNFANTAEWRKAEIPAANGHGTASSLALLYGILSTGGERNGFQVLKPKTIELLRKVHSNGPDLVLFGLNYKFGLGHMVNAPFTPIGLNKNRNMFGHTGIGGSVVFGDVEKSIGFSFFNNQQHKDLTLYETANKLTKAVYQIV